MNKKHKYFALGFGLFLNLASLLIINASDAAAQMPTPAPPKAQDSDDYTWWYVTLFVLLLGLVGAIGWWFNSKKAAQESAAGKPKQKDNNLDTSLDVDKELEWMRKNNGILNRKNRKTNAKNGFPEGLPQASVGFSGDVEEANAGVVELETPLPIFALQKIEHARPFNLLPISNDEALMSAVEQTHEEYEDDEEIRELAVRILAAFKTRNSVEALSQVALYDLSSTLRSKAVSTLADFDHESVFETILHACADPTREVRATAARAFTRLSFDRADAWTRIFETGEKGRMSHAARAAVEGGFVERVFDRLVHRDAKLAYEAVALLALLIKAGETQPIFERLQNDRNPQVWQSILHVIKITDDSKVLNELYALLEQKKLSPDLKKVVDETIESLGLIAA